MADGPRAFVCGHPISHSLSPVIHRYWLEKHGLSGSYEALDIPPESAGRFFRELPGSHWAGGNVTIPHKQTAWKACIRLDPAATAIGAVNTVWLEGDVLCGANTDAYGFVANLDEKAPGWHTGRPALVLGAGGAARAVVHALADKGLSDIRIANRTVSRARELSGRFGDTVTGYGWDEIPDLLANCGLVVNTTALGMTGQPPLDIDLSPLPGDTVVNDIVYAPLVTGLLRQAQDRGMRTVDGLGMLLHQAAPGFERWFGVRPAVDDGLRSHILENIARRP